MNPKKILIFSTGYFPFVGGAEVAIKEITDRLPDFEFDLITARFDKKLPFREKIGNVMVYRLGVGIPLLDKLLLPFEGALFVRHLSKRKKYDAFWGVMATFATGAAYIYNIFAKEKIPTILNLQEGDSERHFTWKWFGLINLSWVLALKRTDYLTVLSKYLKERAERLGYKGRVAIVPMGVYIERFDVAITEGEKMEIRDSLGFKKEDVVLVTTSRLVEKNGVGDVIYALSQLPQNIKFMVCGVGELERDLKLKIENLKLGGRVKFVGSVSHDDLPKYLKSCDIFIRPSLSEGFGVSFIEAMASRLPVIATPVGGIIDFLKDGETGYFCEPANPKSIVNTVEKVLSDKVAKAKIVENAYEMVKENYDWSIITSQMRGVFDTI